MARPTSEDGYELWLRYPQVDNAERLAEYRSAIEQVFVNGSSPTLIIARDELLRGLSGLLGQSIPLIKRANQAGTLTLRSVEHLPPPQKPTAGRWQPPIGEEGYLITRFEGVIQMLANSDVGILYGVFAFLRHLQTHQPLEFPIISAPKIK